MQCFVRYSYVETVHTFETRYLNFSCLEEHLRYLSHQILLAVTKNSENSEVVFLD